MAYGHFGYCKQYPGYCKQYPAVPQQYPRVGTAMQYPTNITITTTAAASAPPHPHSTKAAKIWVLWVFVRTFEPQ